MWFQCLRKLGLRQWPWGGHDAPKSWLCNVVIIGSMYKKIFKGKSS